MAKRSRSRKPRSRGRTRTRSTSAYRTPLSNKRGRYSSRSTSSGSRMSSLVNALDSAYQGNYVNAATQTYKAIRGRAKAPAKRYGYSGDSHFAGFGYPKKIKKQVKVKGKYTQYGIEKLGITNAFEFRKTVSGQEAVILGHTSMPSKNTAINFWRALLKWFLLQMKVVVKDYGNTAISVGFVVGDIFRINRYADSGAMSTSSTSYTIDINDTLDEIAAHFAQLFQNLDGVQDDRFDSMEFLPLSTSRFQGFNVNLVGLQVSCVTNSILKVQNVTVEVTGDNEADDVNAVPLQGKIFGCRGNNFQMKSNKKILSGLYHTQNDEALFEAVAKQNASQIGGTTVGYYTSAPGNLNSEETNFTKPAEIPKTWEITNCKKVTGCQVSPGAIKASKLHTTFTMSMDYFIKMLYSVKATANDRIVYNERQGMTNVMYLEKVVGKAVTANNNINLWTELEFRQSVLIHGGQSKFTLPITYQTDF